PSRSLSLSALAIAVAVGPRDRCRCRPSRSLSLSASPRSHGSSLLSPLRRGGLCPTAKLPRQRPSTPSPHPLAPASHASGCRRHGSVAGKGQRPPRLRGVSKEELMSDQRMPIQRLECYAVAKEIARRVHAANISDTELRDQATRAAKSTFLNLC